MAEVLPTSYEKFWIPIFESLKPEYINVVPKCTEAV
jgi:hypothetical protein